MGNPIFSQANINGVFIPSALLIVGIGIVKTEWLPYAVVIAAVLGGTKIALRGQSRKVLKPDRFQEFPLTQITKTSHNVAIYRFGLPRPDDVLGLPIGQHMSLAATPKGADKEVVRSYTPISSDEDKGFFDLMIKAYPQGNISAHMTTLKVGDTMKVRGPKGAMVYTPNLCRRIGMIAGGTGITPMLQIIRAINRGRPKSGGKDTTKVDLIFANVNPEDILLKDQLDALDKEDSDFSVYYVLNNPPEKWDGGVGFVTADIIKSKLPPPGPDIKILICGPPPMVSAMKKATESLGYQKARPVSKLEDQVFCF
ncbi:NADH-cytochrome b5 reductase 1 [Rhinocladiella mackenziei CBS 650.93]|uniref:NADH-cytochrome b5 reductase n=1 Tax=Rhinocladiella mackenziei CBS 650.93 TaxID=1442369 RepID=A0A0D2IL42_9EURO|nr:NADH-cytochrome b5 reductase 1 [Rhinocladiella mackenziei CBS 650.93]KIX03926.1 NADH-cytochrome b5 reductase 1 [Rhinocladiella mackenziei CBS 650.93]